MWGKDSGKPGVLQSMGLWSWTWLSDQTTARTMGWGWMVVGFGFNRLLQASFQQNTAPSI